MKKAIASVLAIVLLFMASGCSAQPSESKTFQVEKREAYITNQGKRIYSVIYTPYINGTSSQKRYEDSMPCIIMSHGLNGSSLEWANAARFLAEKGYMVIAYDFCGGSTASKSGGSISEMTIYTEKADLKAVLDYALTLPHVDQRSIYLFGNSMGGLVTALCLPEIKNRVKAAVLYYPAFSMCTMFSEPWPDELLGMRLSAEFYESLTALDPYKAVKDFNKPILILHGTADTVVAYSSSEKIASGSSNVKLIAMQGEGHGFSDKGQSLAMQHTYEFLNTVK